MKAEKIGIGKQLYGKRSILADEIPLDAPYVVQLSPASICNFKCNYCIFSIEQSKRPFVSNKKILSLDFHNQIINQISLFSNKIKKLIYCGYGEPLLNNDIAKMVRYAYKKDIADNIDIISNGSLLTPKMSDALFTSGLNTLRISLQGLSSKKYREVSGVGVNFEKLVENLTYFYCNKPVDMKIYIKIISSGLDENQEQDFYRVFGEISDIIAVENLIPAVSEIDYSQIAKESKMTLRGDEVVDHKVCPLPFYFLQINPDGAVMPCCNSEIPILLGNCKNENVATIWKGRILKEFQKQMLEGQKNETCRKCTMYKYGMYQEDVLDNDINNIREKIQ